MILILVILLTLCWGSFLNVVASRIVNNQPFFTKRSYCPNCKTKIAWYDNIPVISWILLRAQCRHCKKPISMLYPFTEIVTAIIITGLFVFFKTHNPNFLQNFFSIAQFTTYIIFFSALIVATRTDLHAMVIPQLFSFWLVPVGALFSFLGLTNITFSDSLFGAGLGYGILWIVAKLFKVFAKKDGLGEGDMELLAMIGAFLGPLGAWFSLTIGSILGLLIGGAYILFYKKNKTARIPFGPFLALGATLYFFFETTILKLF